MIDAYTTHAASALAATSVVRSIVGGTIPIAGLPLYSALGYGWVRGLPVLLPLRLEKFHLMLINLR